VDKGCEAFVGFVGTQGDAFELLELAEEVLDQMPPFVHLLIDGERLCAARVLGNNDLGAAFADAAMMVSESKALSAVSAPNSSFAISGGTPTVSNRCPGSSTKRTRLPSASVSARILVVMPPLERPMAWL
jgi:hypothetical protein